MPCTFFFVVIPVLIGRTFYGFWKALFGKKEEPKEKNENEIREDKEKYEAEMKAKEEAKAKQKAEAKKRKNQGFCPWISFKWLFGFDKP